VRVGIVGFGQFGRALGGLMEEAGVPFLALDPRADIPARNRASGLEDLSAGADLVAFAVPVRALPAALGAAAPFLRPDQAAFDVASVKALPAQWMAERLGPIPHAGSHPLFGPMSLQRAERPLRTIVCPVPSHPGAAERVTDLFRRLGCEVLVQTPEDHDRVMAATHALTFFLAKGLLDAGAGADLPFAPPSFHAIQRTLETVREDASHLFAAIQTLNPFAGEARSRLLEALQAIHAGLEGAQGAADAEVLPPLGIPSPALQEARERIDEVDRELVALLGRRAELSRRAGRAKAALGAPVLDPAREAALLAERRAWAAEAGLDAEAAEDVFRTILRGSRRSQGPA